MILSMLNPEEGKKEKARERARLWRVNNPNGWETYYARCKDRIKARAIERYYEDHEKALDIARRFRTSHRKECVEIYNQ